VQNNHGKNMNFFQAAVLEAGLKVAAWYGFPAAN
jgi:hypothetical protein